MATTKAEIKTSGPETGATLDTTSEGRLILAPEVKDPMEAVRTAMYVLLIGVGGTGAAVMKELIPTLRSMSIVLGETSETTAGFVHPDAMLVDTDLSEQIATVAGEEKESDATAALRKMGVQIVHMRGGVDRKNFLISHHLLDQMTLPTPPDQLDPRGAGADPRSARLNLILARSKNDESDPVKRAEEMVESWMSGNEKPFIGPETRMYIFGGLHGGTGPSALQIGEEIAGSIRPKLDQTGSHLAKIRFAMTGESSEGTINDGMDKKRRLNTATSIVCLNAAYVEKGVCSTPDSKKTGDEVPGADFTFIVGGHNGIRKVDEHYHPAKVVAHVIRQEVGGRVTQTIAARNNQRPRIPDLGEGQEPDLAPQAVFSSSGLAGLRPRQALEEIAAEKRKMLFGKIIGLGEVNEQAVTERAEAVIPENLLQTMFDSVPVIDLTMAEFGDLEELKGEIDRVCNEYVRNTIASLQGRVNRSLAGFQTNLVAAIGGKLAEIKKSKGLESAIAFIEKCNSMLKDMETAANDIVTNGDYSKAEIQARKETIDELAGIMKKTPVPGLLRSPFGVKKKAVLWELGEKAAKLAERYSVYAEALKRQMYLSNLGTRLVAPLKDALQEVEAALQREKTRAEEALAHVDEYEVKNSSPKPLDVLVDVTVRADENPDHLRQEILADKTEWTEEKINTVMKKCRLDTLHDTDLLDYLEKSEVLEALGKNSRPLMRPASGLSAESIARAPSLSVTGVPVDRTEDLERTPAPKGSTKVAVGKDGTYDVSTEVHGFNPLDDGYLRKCIEELLELPPTFRQAQELRARNPHDRSLEALTNREAQFLWQGESKKYLPPWSKSLAERKFAEAGHRGEITKCPGEACGLFFHRTEQEVKRKTGTHCACCRQLQ